MEMWIGDFTTKIVYINQWITNKNWGQTGKFVLESDITFLGEKGCYTFIPWKLWWFFSLLKCLDHWNWRDLQGDRNLKCWFLLYISSPIYQLGVIHAYFQRYSYLNVQILICVTLYQSSDRINIKRRHEGSISRIINEPKPWQMLAKIHI